MKQVPEVLPQLNNQITDLNLLVHAVDKTCGQYNEPPPATQQKVICKTLERAKNLISELEKCAENDLMNETDEGYKVARVVWLRWVDKLKETEEVLPGLIFTQIKYGK